MFGIKTWLRYHVYMDLFVPYKVWQIRRKKKISVVFLLSELPVWKTERLYLSMKRHARFCAVIAITPTLEVENAHLKVIEYCKEKSYDYIVLDVNKKIVDQVDGDIIFYTKPYQSNYYPCHRIWANKRSLFCYVYYAFHSVLEEWTLNEPLFLHSWIYFFENESTATEFASKMKNRGKNLCVTGIPFMDELNDSKKNVSDFWQFYDGRKRVIYAPHHTIADPVHPVMPGISYSTFLDYAEYMLELAERYRQQIVVAFKPHPSLRMKLNSVWGKEKTDAYYDRWSTLENTQLSTGKYLGLFFHSDAMIHDCGSFTMEYLYTSNPVMYLVKETDEVHTQNLTQFAAEAYDCHYKGRTKDDVENFIREVVINGNDILRSKREGFYQEALLPPNGRSACENIIDCILGGYQIEKNDVH